MANALEAFCLLSTSGSTFIDKRAERRPKSAAASRYNQPRPNASFSCTAVSSNV